MSFKLDQKWHMTFGRVSILAQRGRKKKLKLDSVSKKEYSYVLEGGNTHELRQANKENMERPSARKAFIKKKIALLTRPFTFYLVPLLKDLL